MKFVVIKDYINGNCVATEVNAKDLKNSLLFIADKEVASIKALSIQLGKNTVASWTNAELLQLIKVQTAPKAKPLAVKTAKKKTTPNSKKA